jgi:hypothetical protein
MVKKPTITETLRLDYIGLGMYSECKKIEFAKRRYYIYEYEKDQAEW